MDTDKFLEQVTAIVSNVSMSSSALAKQAGVSIFSIDKIKKGTGDVYIGDLIKILSVLGYSLTVQSLEKRGVSKKIENEQKPKGIAKRISD